MRSRFEIYCNILHWGLLNIRNHSDDSERCLLEADHLHNLPGPLMELDNYELHRFYWNVERICFIKHSTPQRLTRFHELWDELEQTNVHDRTS